MYLRRVWFKHTLLGLLAVVVLVAAGMFWIRYFNPFRVRPADIDTKDWILFVSDRSGNPDLWVIRPDGSGLRQITTDPSAETDPAWSPDGRLIAFISDRDDRVPQLFYADPECRRVQQLTVSIGAKEKPQFLPDGKRIVFLLQGQVLLVDIERGEAEKILPPFELEQQWRNTFGGSVLFREPTYDYEKRIVYAVQRTEGGEMLVRYRQGGGGHEHEGETPLEAQPGSMLSTQKLPEPIIGGQEVHVALSPDGTQLAVTVLNNKQIGHAIALYNLVTETLQPLWNSKGDVAPGAVVWEPEGTHLAFEMWRVRGEEKDRIGIGVMGIGDPEPRLIVKGNAITPTWSRGGTSLVYVRFREDGQRDLWTVSSDGSGDKRLTDGTGDNYAPTWSPHP
ncbi:MAG: TolB family protein [Armatimonadota bacterium]